MPPPQSSVFSKMHVLTRRKLGGSMRSERFFLRLQRLFEGRLGFVLVAASEGPAIAVVQSGPCPRCG